MSSLPVAKASHLLLIILGLVAAASHAATQVDVPDLPLRSKDPKKPLELIAERTWSGADVQPTAPPRMRQLALGAAPMGGGRGPVTLVVDYAAYMKIPSQPAGGAISVLVSCPQIVDGCAFPTEKSVVPFEDGFMARAEREVAGQKKVLVFGRESQTYTLAKETPMRVDISVPAQRNLEPVQVTARLVRGEFETRGVPGKGMRIGAIWKAIAGGVLVLGLAFWWLRRG